jgi:hypothetical protein
MVICRMGAIGRTAAVARDLPAYRRGRSNPVVSNLTKSRTGSNSSRNIFSLCQVERTARAATGCGGNASARQQKNTESSCVAYQRRARSHAATVPTSSDSRSRSSRPRKIQTVSRTPYNTLSIRWCCVDLLRPPGLSGVRPLSIPIHQHDFLTLFVRLRI